MQLEQKYELLEAVGELAGERDQTIPAWERSTGKLVFVHLLAGGYNTENNAVLTAVGRLPPENRQRVLGAGDYAGTAYVITDALPWGVTLRNWISNMSPKTETPPAAAPPPHAPETSNAPAAPKKVEAPPTATAPGSDMARAGTWRVPVFDPSAAKPAPPAPPQHEPPVIQSEPDRMVTLEQPAAAAEKEPGEFTRLMRAGMAQPPAPPAAPPPAPPDQPVRATSPAAPPTDREPGEFTQLLRAGKPDPPAMDMPASAGAPVAHDSKPGEFTQLLRAFKSESGPSSAPPVQRTAAPPEPVRSADEIISPMAAPPRQSMPTRQEIPPFPATPAPAADSGSAGEFTSWLNQPVQAPKPKSAPAPPPPAQAPAAWQFDSPAAAPPPVQTAPPVKTGQGEFTQMFATPRTPSPGAPPPPPPPMAREEGGFTQLLRTPVAPAGGIFEPPAPGGHAGADLFQTPGRATPNAMGGPSFTQVIAASTPAPPAVAPPAPAAKEAPPAKPQRSYLPLILILGLLLVLTVVLILVLVLTRR